MFIPLLSYLAVGNPEALSCNCPSLGGEWVPYGLPAQKILFIHGKEFVTLYFSPCRVAVFSSDIRVWFKITINSLQVRWKVRKAFYKPSMYLSGSSKNNIRSDFICQMFWRLKGKCILIGLPEVSTSIFGNGRKVGYIWGVGFGVLGSEFWKKKLFWNFWGWSHQGTLIRWGRGLGIILLLLLALRWGSLWCAESRWHDLHNCGLSPRAKEDWTKGTSVYKTNLVVKGCYNWYLSVNSHQWTMFGPDQHGSHWIRKSGIWELPEEIPLVRLPRYMWVLFSSAWSYTAPKMVDLL